jgi:hypothetical protein
VKLRKESQEDQGNGEKFEPGPLDLEAGVIPVRPAGKKDTEKRDQAE